jgi:hypothetical protein
MAKLDEILAQLADAEDEAGEKMDENSVLKALANSANPFVKKFRSLQFSAGKKEGATSGKANSEELTRLQGEVERLEGELAEAKNAAPEAQKKLQKELDKAQAKTKELETKLGTTTQNLARKERLTGRQKLVKELRELGVNEEYAEEVLAQKYEDRLVVDPEELTLKDVLKPGEDSSYDGKSVDEKIKLLAKELRKGVKPLFIVSGSDRGAGIVKGSTGGPGTGTGVEKVVEQKAQTGEYAL